MHKFDVINELFLIDISIDHNLRKRCQEKCTMKKGKIQLRKRDLLLRYIIEDFGLLRMPLHYTTLTVFVHVEYHDFKGFNVH